jgi:hypothetical protein
MACPSSCRDDACTLTYREHLLGVGIGAEALPTRAGNARYQRVRTRRWERDMAAYKRLKDDGFNPPSIDGAALREKQGQNRYDIEARPVTVDFYDGSG